MFIDQARIFIQAGRGGNGCLSFRREKFIPRGGPNGGNGGRGGDVFLKADPNLTTLPDLSLRPNLNAQAGGNGESWNRAGRAGEDLVIPVPCGTVVWEAGRLLGDLTEPGRTLLAARGGRGGRGNSSFKTSNNSAPRIAEKGEPGESAALDLELKLIADVGLVGCPNAGKSTLLSRISQARPKIADYPFTTLSPNLGVARFKGWSFVVADIPGLIEGAHQGRGLGTEFLRHIERTRVLVHLVDVGGFGEKTPAENLRAVEKEIQLYSKKLAGKPVLVAATKLDLTGARERLRELKKNLGRRKVLGISSATGEGLEGFFKAVGSLLSRKPPPVPEERPPAGAVSYRLGEEFKVEREPEGFRVRGKKVERLFAMTEFRQEEAAARFQNILKKMGVEKALEKAGARPGDTVWIGTMEFAYDKSEGFL